MLFILVVHLLSLFHLLCLSLFVSADCRSAGLVWRSFGGKDEPSDIALSSHTVFDLFFFFFLQLQFCPSHWPIGSLPLSVSVSIRLKAMGIVWLEREEGIESSTEGERELYRWSVYVQIFFFTNVIVLIIGSILARSIPRQTTDATAYVSLSLSIRAGILCRLRR